MGTAGATSDQNPVEMSEAIRAITTALDHPIGPVDPNDVQTILTNVYDPEYEALRVVSGGVDDAVAMVRKTPRLAYYGSGSLGVGASENITITLDLNSIAIPNNSYVESVIVIPSAATRFRLRLYAKSTRLPSDPMWYLYDYPALDTDFLSDVTPFWYVNRDADNKIYGDISNHVAGHTASFAIYILFSPGA